MELMILFSGICVGGQVVLLIWFAVSSVSLIRSQRKQLDIISKAITEVKKANEQYQKEIQRISRKWSEISK